MRGPEIVEMVKHKPHLCKALGSVASNALENNLGPQANKNRKIRSGPKGQRASSRQSPTCWNIGFACRRLEVNPPVTTGFSEHQRV